MGVYVVLLAFGLTAVGLLLPDWLFVPLAVAGIAYATRRIVRGY